MAQVTVVYTDLYDENGLNMSVDVKFNLTDRKQSEDSLAVAVADGSVGFVQDLLKKQGVHVTAVHDQKSQ